MGLPCTPKGLVRGEKSGQGRVREGWPGSRASAATSSKFTLCPSEEPTHSLRASVTSSSCQVFPLLEGALGTHSQPPASHVPKPWNLPLVFHMEDKRTGWIPSHRGSWHAAPREAQSGSYTHSFREKSSTFFFWGRKEKERSPALINADRKVLIWEAN